MSITSVPTGEWEWVEYSATWHGNDFPTAVEDIKITLGHHPIVAWVVEFREVEGFGEEDAYLRQYTAIYIQNGQMKSSYYSVPLDWGEDDIPIGIVAAGTPSADLVAQAARRCLSRMQQLQRREERTVKS